MRRIFDAIHDTLQSDSYQAIDYILKDDSNNGKDKEQVGEDLTKSRRQDSTPDDVKEEGVVEVVGKLTVDAMNKNKKTLLISGDTVECIMMSNKF